MPKKSKAPRKPSKKAPSKNSKPKLIVVNVKMTRAERATLKAYAKRFADGNLSAWVRHAGHRYTPKKGEKIRFKTAA